MRLVKPAPRVHLLAGRPAQGDGLPSGLSEGRCYDKAGRLTAIVTREGAVSNACPATAEGRSRFRYACGVTGNRLSQQEWRRRPFQEDRLRIGLSPW